MAPVCWNCGVLLGTSDQFCSMCGAPTSASGAPNPTFAASGSPPPTGWSTTPEPAFGPPAPMAPPAVGPSESGVPAAFPGPQFPPGLETFPVADSRTYAIRVDPGELSGLLRDQFRSPDLDFRETGDPEDYQLTVRRRGMGQFFGGRGTALVVRIQATGLWTVVSVGEPLREDASAGPFGPDAGTWVAPLTGHDWRSELAANLWSYIESFMSSETARAGRAIPAGQAVHPSMFAGRSEELRRLGAAVQSTVIGRPENLALLGPAGFGKSSLLRKAEELVLGAGCLAVRREVRGDIQTVGALTDYLLRSVMEELKRYLPRTSATVQWITTFWNEHNINLPIPTIGTLGISRRTDVSEFHLERFVKEIEKLVAQADRIGLRAVVVMLDDADNLSRAADAWSFLRSACADLAERRVRFLLVVALRPEARRDGSGEQALPERFLDVVPLRAMDPAETAATLEFVGRFAGCGIEPDVAETVGRLTGGNPYAIQMLGFHAANLARERGLTVVTAPVVRDAVPRAMEPLGDKLYRRQYEAADERERAVLRRLAQSEGPIAAAAFESRSRRKSGSSTASVLESLADRGYLRRDSDGRFTLAGEMFQDFIRRREGSAIA